MCVCVCDRCAECLGYLGPIDPARMNVEIARPDSLIDPGETGLDLAHVSEIDAHTHAHMHT